MESCLPLGPARGEKTDKNPQKCGVLFLCAPAVAAHVQATVPHPKCILAFLSG